MKPLKLVSAKKPSPWKKAGENLLLNTDSGVYYVRKFKQGKGTLFKTTGRTKLGAARTVAEEMIADFIHGKRKSANTLVTSICDELEEYLLHEWENGDRREATKLKDKAMIKELRDLFGSVSISEIDEDFWDQWVTKIGKKLGKNLFDTSKYLSKLMTFSYRRKYVVRKPAIKNPDKFKRAGRVLTETEIKYLADVADQKLIAKLVLGYEVGLRTSEVRKLEKAWVSGNILTLPEYAVKANARSIQLSPRAVEVLKLVNTLAPQSRFYFPSPTNSDKPESMKHFSKLWARLVGAAEITGVTTFYDLRHTFYNKTLLELGLPIQQVSGYGGTSIRTLQNNYLKPTAKSTSAVSGMIQVPVKTSIREKSVKAKS